jgi:signal transduction histidine kinase
MRSVGVRASALHRKARLIGSAAPAKAAPQPAAPVEPGDGVSVAESVTRRLQRLALDVHDGPMQNLAVIGFSLGDLRRRMKGLLPPEEHPTLDAGLEQISDELGRVESELRALIGALEDGVRTRVPLQEAVEAEIRKFATRSDAEVDFVFEASARAETDSQRIAFQSVTRAALANIAKHSGATRVSIRLGGDGERTTLEIADNGSGFSADAPPKPGRLGLNGMRQRVELLGGEFSVASRPGGPTTVTASLRAWRPDQA